MVSRERFARVSTKLIEINTVQLSLSVNSKTGSLFAVHLKSHFMRYLVIALLLFVLGGCKEKVAEAESKPETVNESNPVIADVIDNTMSADTIPKNIQVDSVIQLGFAKDSTTLTAKGHLDKKGDPVICYLPVTKGKRLTANLIPDKAKANIRFSKIHLPDGQTDGPFSPNLKYDLAQKGTYKIYIAPNRMAGDPVSTDFMLKVKVE